MLRMLRRIVGKGMLAVLVLCAVATDAMVTLMRDEGLALFLTIMAQDLLLGVCLV